MELKNMREMAPKMVSELAYSSSSHARVSAVAATASDVFCDPRPRPIAAAMPYRDIAHRVTQPARSRGLAFHMWSSASSYMIGFWLMALEIGLKLG